MIYIPARWKLFGFMGILLLGIGYPNGRGGSVSMAAAQEHADPALHEHYAQDPRLKLTGHEIREYGRDGSSAESGLENSYTRTVKIYDEEEKAKFSHAYFDEQSRLLYVLGYSADILGNISSYCEENIYQRNDEEHTCRYLYYKSNSMPYEDGFYVAYRYLFEVSDFQYDEAGRLRSSLSYRRNVGSDPYGYSEELFFSRGYEAEYDGARLMSELQYHDFWGTNEVGVWEYRIYQYDERGDRIQTVTVTEDEITLCCWEYHEEAGQIEEYTYLVTDDWEFSCGDGSTCYLSPERGGTAVRKVAADGTVEKELFYGKAMDLGQQHDLMPEEVEETVDDHIYTVRAGDCLWDIAYRSYGHGAYYDLIHRVNRGVIGRDEDLLQPGMRLYVPEAGNAQDTKTAD